MQTGTLGCPTWLPPILVITFPDQELHGLRAEDVAWGGAENKGTGESGGFVHVSLS